MIQGPSIIVIALKAIKDLGLDVVALVEHQHLPGDPDRLSQLAQDLNGGTAGLTRTYPH